MEPVPDGSGWAFMLLDLTPDECRKRVARLITEAAPEPDPVKRHALLQLADRCVDLLRRRRPERVREPRSFASE